jgi:hypothetical protein
VTFSTRRARSLLLRLAAAAAVAAGLVSCSGGVDPSPDVSDPTRITILPATAVMYSGLPTTFSITGGTGAYVVTSNNQAVIPSPGSLLRNTVTIVPNNVTAEVSGIVLTVRDTGTNAPVTAVVAVRPGTVANDVTITPNSQQSSSCNPAICSGGDAEVKVTISQGGIPLAARGVRFEVITGDFAFITTPPGTAPETTAVSVSVATDETGIARARFRAQALAPNQTALLQITDISTGAFRRTSFAIAQFTGNTPAYFTLPSAITFTGPFSTACASSAATSIAVFGGSPPYTVTGGSSGFSISAPPPNPNPNGTLNLPASGDRFTITLSTTPFCFENLPVAVTDSTGRTLSVLVSNKLGTGDAPPAPISLEPSTISICRNQTATIAIVGGGDTFAASTGDPNISIVQPTSSRQFSFTVSNVGQVPRSATINVTDGVTTGFATINIGASPPCP